MEYDEVFLARAFKLARLGRLSTAPNPNVGCVIVRAGQILGEGYHRRAGEPHAEIHALRRAGAAARGSTAYVTLEPCAHQGRTLPCTDALINAGVTLVVAAMSDPNPEVAGRGFYRLQQAGIDVRYGFMLREAEEINSGFLKRMRTGLPFVRLKLASSLDGRTAMASGESQWITSFESRRDVQRWRAESDAILSTATTVLIDNPALTVRWSLLPEDVQCLCSPDRVRQPIRVIIDSTNRIRPGAQVLHKGGRTVLARLKIDGRQWPSTVEQIIVPGFEKEGAPSLDLMTLMLELGRRQINSIWVEAGAGLAGALLSAELVDELILYQAPKLLGATARPLFLLPRLEELSAAPQLTLLDVRQVGPDICLRLKPNPIPH